MDKKRYIYLLIVILLLLSISPLSGSSEHTKNWWDTQWSYRQEIILPSNIDYNITAFQPIDLVIHFKNPCWAENETIHSIRVIKQNQKEYQELENQIYNLDYVQERILQSCHLVFLIPENTTPNDIFYIYYDDSATSQATYIDHVSIRDSSYYYEPISGYPLSSNFYDILQDGNSIYAISQEGRFMDYFTSQSVTKLSVNTTTVAPNSGQAVASFDYSFFYGDTLAESYTTGRTLVSKQINVDGNLMVSCTIKSMSSTKDMFSTVTYKYYYCPASEKRIFSKVVHEINNAYTTAENVLTDGIYTTLFISSVKSAAIEQLNFGTIPRYIHYRNENNEFKEYSLDPNPPFISTGECIPVISKEHDQDLSTDPWISFDDGKSGVAHAVLFNTTQVVTSGEDERDGVQIKAYELDTPHLPGFENNMAVILLGRNSYETLEGLDTQTPKDFVISFNAEFFSTPTGGYPQVINESRNFRSFSTLRHQNGTTQNIEKEKEQTYNLTVFVHNAFTLPQSQTVSLLTGLNLSFIQVEVYQNTTLICSGSPSRIHIHSSMDVVDVNLPDIFQLFTRWDWKKTTLFPSIQFPDLPKGSYVVKVIRYHPLLHKNPQYIGVKTIQLQDSMKTHVTCTKQKEIDVSVVDQNNQPVEDIQVWLVLDDIPVSMNTTNNEGKTTVSAPASNLQTYEFLVIYKGFLISHEPIRLSKISYARQLKREIQLERYTLHLIFKDAWNLPPAREMAPIVTGDEQQIPYSFHSQQLAPGEYSYCHLPKASYILKHPSTGDKQHINLDSDQTYTIFLNDTYQVTYTIFNKRGLPVSNLHATLTRENKTISSEINGTNGSFLVPPGTYMLTVNKDSQTVGVRHLQVYSDSMVDIVTTIDPIHLEFLVLFSVILLFIGSVFTVRYKTFRFVVGCIILILFCYTLLAPWWTITGETDDIESTTALYSIPPNLVTMYTNETIQTGELSGLPQMVNDAFVVFTVLLLTGFSSQLLWMLFYTRISSLQTKTLLFSLIAALLVTGGFIGSTIIIVLLSDVTVGSFVGGGVLEMMVPGGIQSQFIKSIWAPDIGWYSALALCSVVWLTLFVQQKQRKEHLKKED